MKNKKYFMKYPMDILQNDTMKLLTLEYTIYGIWILWKMIRIHYGTCQEYYQNNLEYIMEHLINTAMIIYSTPHE